MKRLFPLTFLLGLALVAAAQQPTTPKDMNTAYYSYEVQTLTLPSGQEVAYTDTGAGPRTLLLIHGLGSYLPVYDKLIPRLADQYRCVAIDLPGFGQSGWPVVDTVSMAWYASQVEAFIEALALEQVTLLGHSMGGQISLRTALNGQAPVEALVLLAPAGIETFTAEEAAQMKLVVTPASIEALEETQIQANFAVNFATNQLPEDARFMYEDRLELKADEAAYAKFSAHFPQCVAAMLDGPVYAELSQLKVPTLVLFGENDYLIPNRYLHPELTTAAVGDSAQAVIPRCEVKMLPQCGHFVPWEQPELVQQALLEFAAAQAVRE